MSACPMPSAAYDTPAEAKKMKQNLLRRHHLPVTVYLCTTCDKYHLHANASRIRIPKKQLEQLRLLALGHSTREISQIISEPWKTVRWRSDELLRHFSAINVANLVATAIALGVLNPKEFVPELTERKHR